MALHTAVVYGSARRGRQGIRAARILDEHEWYANALKAARMKETCDITIPVQQGLCRGEQ